MAPNADSGDRVLLYRGGAAVSSFLGAFGGALRETRLTAALGYLIALRPQQFADILGFRGRVLAVSVEPEDERGRTDIEIKTTHGKCVVEGKVSFADPTRQVLGYAAKWRVVLSPQPVFTNGTRGRVRCLSWQSIADHLRHVSRRSGHPFKSFSLDMIRHLEEHNMARQEKAVEVFAREINNERTLALFLKTRMYTCVYERSSSLPKAMYFAPHFGAAIAREHPGISQGISYIARIEKLVVVGSLPELLEAVRQEQGKSWEMLHRAAIVACLSRQWKGKRRKESKSVLLLGEPRLVFNPPVKKTALQKGSGWLSRRTFSFDELFAAWRK